MRVLMIEYHLRRRWEHNERSQQHMERYRSGHNEAVLKTVCPQGRMGSNPILSVGRFAAEFYIEIKSANCRSTQAAEGAPLERE